MDVVRQVRYDSAFTFIYSKRTGTPAAAMEDQVSSDVVQPRFDRLLAEVQKIAGELCGRDAGTVQRALVEGIDTHDASLAVSYTHLDVYKRQVKASVPNEPMAAEATVPTTEEETSTSAPMFRIYLTDEGILVYYPDERTVYKKIPILPEDLSESDREELADGIAVPDEEELYHYLESITS